MHLAKGKNGQIGRQLDSPSLQAQVITSPKGERRGNVYLSTRQIEEDQAYFAAEEAKASAKARAKQIAARAKLEANRLEGIKKAEAVASFQRLAAIDPMNEKLKRHFAKTMGMSETERVADSVLSNPANFSQEGGNPQFVLSDDPVEPVVWSADYRQHLIVGNPLTRDGKFGPATTDFDRFVRGTDVNQDNVVKIAGGTMLGRYDGKSGQRGMGFDFSWDGFTSGISDTISNTVDNLVAAAPDVLSQQLIDELQGGTATQTGNVITAYRPTGVPKTISQTMGIPNWALYSGLGLIGVGVIFMMIKAVKK